MPTIIIIKLSDFEIDESYWYYYVGLVIFNCTKN